MSQSVLPLLPAGARSVGPSAGLLEDAAGAGVVFVFGLATYTFAAGDEVGRRLSAVQLSATEVALVAEIASAFGVDTSTLWRWTRAFADGGVLALAADRRGPKGPSKLTSHLRDRIVALDADGLSLRQIATQTGVSTATIRVALGRVATGTEPTTDPTGTEVVTQALADADEVADEVADVAEVAEVAEVNAEAEQRAGALMVLAAPQARVAERVAARFGDLTEAPVVITQGAQLPLAGLLLCLPALEMTGLLGVAEQVFTPMRK